jgi:hypothetical protein
MILQPSCTKDSVERRTVVLSLAGCAWNKQQVPVGDICSAAT